MDPTQTAAGSSIQLTGDAGCVGCLFIVGVPAFVVWRLKRRLFGHSQPDLNASHFVSVKSERARPSLDALQQHDPTVSYELLSVSAVSAFQHMTARGDASALAWIASPEIAQERGHAPWRSVVEHVNLLSATSEAGRDRMLILLAGHLARRPFWWKPWQEQWTFERFTPKQAPSDGLPICANCGAPLQATPQGLCQHCGFPAPGAIGTWRLVARNPIGGALFG